MDMNDIPALLQNPRNVYIGIGVLVLVVAFGPGGLKVPAYLGVIGLVVWIVYLSVEGRTARQIPVEKILGVLSDVIPLPTARMATIAGYPNSGTVEGATRFKVRGQEVYMKTLAPLVAGEAVLAMVTPNRDRTGPFADVAFEVLALRNDSRRDDNRYLRIPEPRMQVPEGTRLWVAVALSALFIGFLVPIYFIVVIKRSYDIKIGWQRAMGAALRIIAPAGALADSTHEFVNPLLG